MEVSKTQKISFRIVFTLMVCMMCLTFVAPQQVEAGMFRKAYEAVKTKVTTACKAVAGFVKGAVELATGTTDGGEEEPVESAISFEDVGEMAAIYFSTNSAPDADSGKIPGVGMLNSTYENGENVDAGNAGLFVAYAGKSWLSSLLTQATTSASYDSYMKVPVSSSGTTRSDAVYDYASYGAVLASAGLDKSGYEMSAHFLSWIGGGLIYLLYLLSIGLNGFFETIFTVLDALNPFRLFYKGVNAANGAAFEMAGYDTTSTAGSMAHTAFAGLTTFLKKWYVALYGFSWEVLVPICFVLLAVSIVLFRHTGKWKNMLKKYVIRVAFLIIGVPLLGGIYTKALEDMSSAVSPGESPVTKLILSTYVDFESWAEHGRLSLNKSDGSLMNLPTSNTTKGNRTASGAVKLNVRNIAFQINKAYSINSTYLGNPLFADYKSALSSYNTNSNTSNTFDSSSSSDGVSVSDMTDADISIYNNGTSLISHNSLISATTDVLLRYMQGKYYTSGEYEGLVKAQLSKWAQGSESKGNVILNQFATIVDVSSFYVASDGDCYKSHRGRLVDLNHFGKELKKDSDNDDQLIETEGSNTYGVNVYANGGIHYSAGTYKDEAHTPAWNGLESKTYGFKGTYGLSSCSMYNYLNSSFTSSSVTCYSPSNIASTFIRQSHYSVNIVGTGITSFLYWLNCFMMILCYVVIGYFYAIGMMFSNISRMFQVVKAIPFAMIGGIKSIAEVITYTFVMIIEVVMSIFLFEVIIEIMFSVPDIFTGALCSAYGRIDSEALVNWGMPIILTFLVIFYGWFMTKALKMRKKFIKSLSEAAEEIVDKFIGVKTDVVAGGVPGSGGGKSIIGGAIGGAAAGMGAAMAGNLMTKDAEANDDQNGPSGNHADGAVGDTNNNITANNSDNSVDNSKDDARIDSPESNRDALDKKEAGRIGTSLGDSGSKGVEDSKDTKKSFGEKLGESKESRGLKKEAKGLEKEAKGLEKEAKGDDKVHQGNKKIEASKDLKAKANKDKAQGSAKVAAGKAMGLAGAGLYVSGKAQQVKSAGEMAAAKVKASSGKHDVKAGEKMQAKGQKVQAQGQKMQKKGIDVQASGQTKQIKAQNNQATKAQNKQVKAEAKAQNKQAKAEAKQAKTVSASGVAKRSQAEQLRGQAASTQPQPRTNRPNNMSGKQAKAQSVSNKAPRQTQGQVSNNNSVGGGQQQAPQKRQPQQQAPQKRQPQKQSVRQAMVNGAKQGMNQAMANRSADGSISQQYFQAKANSHQMQQQVTNYRQASGTLNQQQPPVRKQPVNKPPKVQNQTVVQNTTVQQRQTVVEQRQTVTQQRSDALDNRMNDTSSRGKKKK